MEDRRSQLGVLEGCAILCIEDSSSFSAHTRWEDSRFSVLRTSFSFSGRQVDSSNVAPMKGCVKVTLARRRKRSGKGSPPRLDLDEEDVADPAHGVVGEDVGGS